MRTWPLFVLLPGLWSRPLCAAPPASAAPVPAARPPLDLAALDPYFESGAALKDGADRRHPNQARFLQAVAALQQAREPAPAAAKEAGPAALKAARLFDQLVKPYPLLLHYHRLFAAQGYLLGGQPKLALERAAQIPADAVQACEARVLRGDAQRALGQLKEAAAAYRDYLDTCAAAPGGIRQRVRAHLVEVHEGLGQTDAATALQRALYLEAPTEPAGATAERALGLRGPHPRATFTAAELLGRALILFDNMRNPESEAAYGEILARPDLTPKERCTARYYVAQSVFKQRQRPRAAPLFEQAIKDCGPDGAADDDLHMRSLYQGARCHGSKGELQAAADLFAQAEAAHPGHSFADDARVRQAEMYADLQERLQRLGPRATCDKAACPDYEGRKIDLLKDVPERYPGGDQRAEALWRLSFGAYRKADYKTARLHLTDALRRIPREVGWDQEGRTLYWLGRLSELEQDVPGAVERYRRAVIEYPLSFYSLLSLNRLREAAPQAQAALLQEITREPPGEGAPWRFPHRPLFDQPGFLRGVELMRLGLGNEARAELAAVGVKAPEGKGLKVASPEQEELLWLAAVLYNRSQKWYLSHWIPRHTLTGYQRRYPVGDARKEWELSYPRGYADLLTEAAKKNGQPEALQFAIVREESAFDPLSESFANAIGLTQMIPPTARRFAAGLPTTREALRDPATNVAIGARFLGFLWSTMQGHPALSIAGYNAGENAVFRWLRDRGDLDLDAWIESIPYDETRGYTKRVLSSYLTYSWLAPSAADWAARVPVLSLKLPALPQVRKVTTKEEDPHRK